MTDLALVVLLGLLGASAWGLVVFYATNAGEHSFDLSYRANPDGTERLASSVVRQVTFQLRNSADVSAVLGDRVKLVNNWWSKCIISLPSSLVLISQVLGIRTSQAQYAPM